VKITTRLILLFLAVSILPLVIVSYIGLRAIDSANSLALNESTEALRQLGESSIEQKALAVAQQVALYLEAHPESLALPPEELEADKALAAIAVQPVGETGYTAVYDSHGVTHFHANPDIVGMDMRELAKALPAFWAIFEASLDGTIVGDYYEWQDADGIMRDKYMSCVPVQDTHLRVAATTYIDEFYQPIRDIEAKTASISRETRLSMYAAVSIVGMVAVLTAILLAALTIRPLNRLAEGMRLFSQRKLDHEIPGGARDEIGQLAATFNQMARELKKTLQEKDDIAQQLHELNHRLEQMVDSLRQRMRQLETIYHIGQLITANVELDDALEAILEETRRIIPYSAAEICLSDPERNSLKVNAWAGAQGSATIDTTGYEYTLGEGYTGWIGAHGESLLVPDVHAYPELTPTYRKLKPGVLLNSFIGVPMLLGGKLVGTLELVHTERNHFTQDHLRLLTLIATQAAVAIENARLVQQREERLKQQIEELSIEIDEVKKAQQVAEITETEYFQELQETARSMREETRRA
jgi:HAMP domain-containing protein/putative methionine-R-sulfoxide reductase with GAF domain